MREKASVITYSPGIPADHKAKLGHTHAPSVQWAVDEALQAPGAKCPRGGADACAGPAADQGEAEA
ncbi:MAG: hypothetical protein MZV70_28780 [Desulfobacterales bacterium]|nr:hypothetical protein [Desulfobacterales bacterium]